MDYLFVFILIVVLFVVIVNFYWKIICICWIKMEKKTNTELILFFLFLWIYTVFVLLCFKIKSINTKIIDDEESKKAIDFKINKRWRKLFILFIWNKNFPFLFLQLFISKIATYIKYNKENKEFFITVKTNYEIVEIIWKKWGWIIIRIHFILKKDKIKKKT